MNSDVKPKMVLNLVLLPLPSKCWRGLRTIVPYFECWFSTDLCLPWKMQGEGHSWARIRTPEREERF